MQRESQQTPQTAHGCSLRQLCQARVHVLLFVTFSICQVMARMREIYSFRGRVSACFSAAFLRYYYVRDGPQFQLRVWILNKSCRSPRMPQGETSKSDEVGSNKSLQGAKNESNHHYLINNPYRPRFLFVIARRPRG